MQCWICHRQARGFRHADLRYRVGDAQYYPLAWVFCSMRCAGSFHRLYQRWLKQSLKQNPSLSTSFTHEACMIDMSELEAAALKRCLPAFGKRAAHIGFDKPLGLYTEEEALDIITAIVATYCELMSIAHQRLSYAPIRTLADVSKVASTKNHPAVKQAPFNLSNVFDEIDVDAPFADMVDDIPWEA